MKTRAPPRTAVVCMVYNGLEYLSEFITYHLLLCDHLYIIDHNSDIDLRQVQIDRVTFVRSNHEAQLQSECTNVVIRDFDIKKKYDWLFVLDIDEFLPFSSRSDLNDFLSRHANRPVLQFHWRNGVPFYDETGETPSSLIDCARIGFFRHDSVHFKSFVNIASTGDRFFVPTGAHHINRVLPKWRAWLSRGGTYKIYKAKISEVPLMHILAFNKNSFVRKIKNYVEQMKYREHIKGQGGWVVRDYPDELSDDQWLWYVANFRVSKKEQFQAAAREDFIDAPVFAHLDKNEVVVLREKIKSLATSEKKKALPEETRYLSHKKDDRDVMENIEWFRVAADGEIVTVAPGAA